MQWSSSAKSIFGSFAAGFRPARRRAATPLGGTNSPAAVLSLAPHSQLAASTRARLMCLRDRVADLRLSTPLGVALVLQHQRRPLPERRRERRLPRHRAMGRRRLDDLDHHLGPKAPVTVDARHRVVRRHRGRLGGVEPKALEDIAPRGIVAKSRRDCVLLFLRERIGVAEHEPRRYSADRGPPRSRPARASASSEKKRALSAWIPRSRKACIHASRTPSESASSRSQCAVTTARRKSPKRHVDRAGDSRGRGRRGGRTWSAVRWRPTRETGASGTAEIDPDSRTPAALLGRSGTDRRARHIGWTPKIRIEHRRHEDRSALVGLRDPLDRFRARRKPDRRPQPLA